MQFLGLGGGGILPRITRPRLIYNGLEGEKLEVVAAGSPILGRLGFNIAYTSE